MNSDNVTTGRLTLRADHATAVASSRHRANIDGVGFNLVFIARRQPMLASKVLRLYRQASQIKEDDPKAHDEDYLVAKEQLDELLAQQDAGPLP